MFPNETSHSDFFRQYEPVCSFFSLWEVVGGQMVILKNLTVEFFGGFSKEGILYS